MLARHQGVTWGICSFRSGQREKSGKNQRKCLAAANAKTVAKIVEINFQ